MPRWPENPDDYVDPAIAPLIEAGEGESVGFDLAEADLVRHAEHGDEHGTDRIWPAAAGFRPEEIRGLDDGRHGAPDDEDPETSPSAAASRDLATRPVASWPVAEAGLDVVPFCDRGMGRGPHPCAEVCDRHAAHRPSGRLCMEFVDGRESASV